ncbi:MAG: helix-turn-helix transcriptional regulator [Gemmiger sp.]|uniref:helix-turn-helix domain-containing protein n=1 Tax=Gemmiger sp. TaxID=2049027 RepID=UPI002A9092D4|nr:helix-turn-helix transcriptional regulator [Gemmiger sp.]MDY5327006.1 helix-turn-helix transcriptional regulator [Gemmiger sp.]
MATFPERLRSLRNEKGWSQQRLAEELGLSKSSVNMYERGEREPGFETMESFIGWLKQHTNVTILSAHRYFV